MAKKQALGRGLDALIPDVAASDLEPRPFFYCDIDSIRPNPYQPRRRFPEQDLKDLSDSIKEKGIIQPLVVRTVSTGYELIVGERRWRAARAAGLKQVPVVSKDVTGSEMMEMALVENIQRQDLNPLEKAEGYYRLIKEYGLTQEEIAQRVGQDRSTVANFLRAALKSHRGPDADMTDFRKLLKSEMRALSINESFATRYLNDGFSGGEKKRVEILQMSVLNPRMALLDETDSGLDIDALKTVAEGINRYHKDNNGILMVTHYQRLLNYVKPDFVHVMMDGRFVISGGPELALKLEESGYDWVENEVRQKAEV